MYCSLELGLEMKRLDVFQPMGLELKMACRQGLKKRQPLADEPTWRCHLNPILLPHPCQPEKLKDVPGTYRYTSFGISCMAGIREEEKNKDCHAIPKLARAPRRKKEKRMSPGINDVFEDVSQALFFS